MLTVAAQVTAESGEGFLTIALQGGLIVGAAWGLGWVLFGRER